jgi:hypothetical protein
VRHCPYSGPVTPIVVRLGILLLGSLLPAATLVGCDTDENIKASEVRSLVLRPADLSEDFGRFDEGPGNSSGREPPPAGRAEPEAGWVARFRHLDPRNTDGPLVIESRARVFEDEDAAQRDLDEYRRELLSGGATEVEAGPELGEEAWAVALQQPALPRAVVYFTVAWRRANVTASVTVQGFDGKITLEDTIALARKQEDRLSAASG